MSVSVIPTYWTLRQSLLYALKSLILTQAIPAINADLAARTISTNAADIPQFSDASVVIGDVPVPPQPTLCIIPIARRNVAIATGTMLCTLTTKVKLKTPYVADSAPEDFTFLASVMEDNLEDLLTCLQNRVIKPVNPADGSSLLPFQSAFYECTSIGSNIVPSPVKSADGVTMYYGWELSHRAQINLALSRGDVVGTAN